MRDLEHNLQVNCVRWFRYQYPLLRHCLVAVPNGGRRDAATGAKLKDEGVVAGVADLNFHYRGHTLFIEMKTPTGRQSLSQKEWQRAMEAQGFQYVVCRSLEDFMRVVNGFIKQIDTV